MKQYGKAIKSLRRNADMTQAQLAQKLNVSAQTVSKWENEVNLPDIYVIEEICSLFGVAMEEFIKLAETDGQNSLVQVQREAAQQNGAVGGNAAPATEVYAASAAPAATVRTRDKRLWIIIVAAVIGSIIAIGSLIAPVIYLTKRFGLIKFPQKEEEVISVVFNGGGGYGGIKDGTVKVGESFTLPENGFIRNGYKFVGWKYDGQMYNPGDVITSDGSKDVLKVEAVWSGITYNVTFTYEGQTIDYTYKYGQAYYAPPATFERTGYTQTGWFCNGNKYSAGGNFSNLTVVDNVTLVCEPVWTPVTYKMILEFGKWWERDEIICTYGENPFTEYQMPDSYGLVFEGWTVYSADGNVYEGDLRYLNSDANATVRAKANWVSGSYSIYLYDGEFALAPFKIIPVEGREEYTIPLFSSFDDIERQKGYHFGGWELDGTKVTVEDGATVSDLMMTMPYYESGYSGYWVELRAVWLLNEYTVKFDGGGAQGNMKEMKCRYDEEYYLPANEFVKEGYTFAGWQYGDEIFCDEDEISSLTEDDGAVLTFTALWIKNS